MCKKCDTSKCSSRSKKNDGKVGWKGWCLLTVAGLAAYGLATDTQTATADSPKTEPIAATTKVQHSDLEARCLKVGKAATKQGITGNDRARIIAISAAESKCKSMSNKGLNKDGTEDVCEMQINKAANADLFKGRDWHKLDDCMWMASKVLGRQGYQAWSSYNNRSYREFVPMALKLNGELS